MPPRPPYAGREMPPGSRVPDDELSTPGLRRIEGAVERAIRDAIERGEFDDLQGAGAPLPRDEADLAGERWAAMRVLRNANALPEWLQLRIEVRTLRDGLIRRARGHLRWLHERRALLERLPGERILEAADETARLDRAFREGLAKELGELNAVVARYNAAVPVGGLQLAPLGSERILALAESEND